MADAPTAEVTWLLPRITLQGVADYEHCHRRDEKTEHLPESDSFVELSDDGKQGNG